MSDIGLFPAGFEVWLFSLGWAGVCALAFLVTLLVAWWRTRRAGKVLSEHQLFGWAVGAAASALVAGASMWLVNWSGSLGAFAHWIDQRSTTYAWLLAQAVIWPAVAFFWNRRRRV